ncbi:MAG: bifunctional (p)ppGpp synthetase/guanosine-3',5'-bis(diphosphate) 3'-pyrophosphohydrolase [Chthonomonas sp.]|nr:bifunctional (p)ppGpp synthetase/guanosine-3',5'-bis(diphosphate) 3'-pyrophosphohydrolase [Chthonomonas sp.]
MEMLARAAQLMTEAHAGQWTDHEPPLPYVVHPSEVVLNLQHIGGITDPTMLAAAFLHDTVEHGNISPETIAEQFGPEIAALVKELTRDEPTAEELEDMTKAEVWELRSYMLLRDIEEMSDEAQTIKLADRLSNVKIANAIKSADKLIRYHAQTRTILHLIAPEVNPALWQAVANELLQPG